MKLRLPRLMAVTALAAIAAIAVVASGCGPRKRSDWRSPAPPLLCKSDADCRGGKCTFDDGASQGTCSGQAPLPLLPPQQDGGTPSPGPNVQPSPNDIQI